MDWYLYPLIILAGFLAGMINMYAGSGSLVSLALLVFAGLPPSIANGTNRIAIILQNMVGTRGYYQHGLLDVRHGLKVAIPAMIGSIVGSSIVVTLDEQALKRAIGVVMVGMLLVMLIRPKRWIEGRAGDVDRNIGWQEGVIFFLIGIYGGFIQAGVGIFLLAGLVLKAGFDLMQANAIKVLIVLCLTIPALIVFVFNDQVDWVVGLILAIGNMSGAWVATRFANRPGIGVWAHRLLVGIVIFSAVRLLFFPES